MNTKIVGYSDSQCTFESSLSLFTFVAGEDHDHCQVKAERGERRSQVDARLVEPKHLLQHQGKTSGNKNDIYHYVSHLIKSSFQSV